MTDSKKPLSPIASIAEGSSRPFDLDADLLVHAVRAPDLPPQVQIFLDLGMNQSVTIHAPVAEARAFAARVLAAAKEVEAMISALETGR